MNKLFTTLIFLVFLLSASFAYAQKAKHKHKKKDKSEISTDEEEEVIADSVAIVEAKPYEYFHLLKNNHLQRSWLKRYYRIAFQEAFGKYMSEGGFNHEYTWRVKLRTNKEGLLVKTELLDTMPNCNFSNLYVPLAANYFWNLRVKKPPLDTFVIIPFTMMIPEDSCTSTNFDFFAENIQHDSLILKIDPADTSFVQPQYLNSTVKRKFINYNFNYPAQAKAKRKQGKVTLSYVVQSNGDIGTITVTKSSGVKQLDQEAIRILSLFPKSKPAQKDGKFVACQMETSIDFRLSD